MNKNLEIEKAFDSMWYEVAEDIERGEHVDGQWIKDILELKGFTLVKNSDLKKSINLRKALTYALAQEDLTYGMEGESVDKFKLRKVFSVLREALEE